MTTGLDISRRIGEDRRCGHGMPWPIIGATDHAPLIRPPQMRDHLDMVRLREHVERAQRDQFIAGVAGSHETYVIRAGRSRANPRNP